MFPTLREKMNHLVVFGLILMCCQAQIIVMNDHFPYMSTQARPLNKVEKFLEAFKEKMKKGDESLGIPVLDPLIQDQVPININETALQLDALFTNVRVDSLSEYNVLSGNFKLLGFKFNMNLSWPIITGSTDYAMTGKSEYFDIYGKGKINLSVHDFDFWTEIGMTIADSHFKVKHIKSALSLRALDFRITGLFNDEELSKLISAIVSDMVPQLIRENHDMIAQQVSAMIEQQLNDFLKTKSIEDIIKIIG